MNKAQERREAAVARDADDLRLLLVKLQIALNPAISTPRQDDGGGKPGKRPYGTIGVNPDVHDAIRDAQEQVWYLSGAARRQLGDSDRVRSTATPVVTDYRLQRLPDLVRRLHAQDAGASQDLANRIAKELRRLIALARRLVGESRPTFTLAACPILDGKRPCGLLTEKLTWREGKLIAYADVDRTRRLATGADHDVWCDTCGTRWPASQFSELATALLEQETA